MTAAAGAEPVVDAHHHLWDPSRHRHAWLDKYPPALNRTVLAADLAPLARAAGVTATVVVQAIADPAETDWLLAVASADPPVVAVVGWVDVTAPGVADRLAALRAAPGGHRLVGIRVPAQGITEPGWFARPDVRRGIAAVGAAGLAVDLLVRSDQLPDAMACAAALDGVRFVLDHAAKPPIARGEREPWATDLRMLARLPHVTCKLSGLVTEADRQRWSVADLRPYAAIVLDAFGPDRVMAGSDWPVCLLAASYDRVLDTARDLVCGLAAAERRQVLARTATDVYRLDRLPEDRRELRP